MHPRKSGNRKAATIKPSKKWSKKQVGAGILIFALMVADIFTIMEFYTSMNLDWLQTCVYSVTLALCLEGLPMFLGISASKLLDTTNYKKNDVINAMVGGGIALIGLFGAFYMVVSMRADLIKSYGGEEAWIQGTYAASSTVDWQPNINSTYLKDRFLKLSPVLTSLLALVASWVAFPSDGHLQLEWEMDAAHMEYVQLESQFHIARNTVDLAMASLWKDLADSDTNMPRETNTFRKECYARIRNQLLKDCLAKYPGMIDTYNAEIRAKLTDLLGQMPDKKYTTIPYEISKLELDKMLKAYDGNEERQKNPITSWSGQTAKDPLMDHLKVLVNNAVVMAQFRSTTGTKYKEGSRY